MALNKFMHPRNRYKGKKPDFKALAVEYPEFRKHVTINLAGRVYVDYKDPLSLRALTCTLLKHDFHLDVHLPLNRLIPTVPLRLNYIHWLEDVVGKHYTIKGIDIGTGSSCIYPLLGCKLNNWHFLATEVDEENYNSAMENVERNGFSDSIRVCKVSKNSLLLDVIGKTEEVYDFSMCNPPFYSDHLEAQAITTSRSIERPEPSSISTACEGECIARGGEVVFVKKMITESQQLKDRIRVFTSMVGKKGSVAVLKGELRKLKVPKIATTEFCQGKTMRWGIAWTYDKSVDFPKSHFQPERKEKPPLSYTIPQNVPGLTYDVCAIQKYIENLLQLLKIQYVVKKSSQKMATISVLAKENTWSNQRRKRRQKLHETDIKKSDIANSNEDATSSVNLVMSENRKDCQPVETDDENKKVQKRQVFDKEYSSSTTPSLQSLNYDAKTKNKEYTCSELSANQNLLLCEVEEKQINVDPHSVKNRGKKRLLNESDDNQKIKKQKTSEISLNAKIQNCETLEQDECTSNQNDKSSLPLVSNNLDSDDMLSNESEKIHLHGIYTEQQYTQKNVSSNMRAKGAVTSTGDDKCVDIGEQMNSFTVMSEKIVEANDKPRNLGIERVTTTDSNPPECNKKFLLKSQMTILQRTQEIVLELAYEVGQNREYMHQLMQYFKNRLRSDELL